MLSVAIVLASSLYLEAAQDAARWLTASGRTVEAGRFWPPDPERPDEVVTHLYSGSSGVVLFFLEAHRLTGDASYLAEARAGADFLVASLPERVEANATGLYTGIAGLGFVLGETYRATGDERYRSGALRTVELLAEAARSTGAGVAWNETTDVIGGSAGIGLYLIHAARSLNLPEARALAVRAGERLVEQAQRVETGSKWAMNEDFPRLMPNFSHGTAGVAYFLATLYQESGEKRFLDAALAGASYLKTIADVEDDACLIFHNEPDGVDLYYLSWCHGPAGTARLFYRLHQISGDADWLEWVMMSARGILSSGIPEKRTAGFWNNISQCCGSAGVAEFFLNVHAVTGQDAYLDFAKRMTADLLARGQRDASGVRWPQAENRTQPELIQAQTGYMQGAAGVGLWLLRLHAYDNSNDHGERGAGVTLPDSPF